MDMTSPLWVLARGEGDAVLATSQFPTTSLSLSTTQMQRRTWSSRKGSIHACSFRSALNQKGQDTTCPTEDRRQARHYLPLKESFFFLCSSGCTTTLDEGRTTNEQRVEERRKSKPKQHASGFHRLVVFVLPWTIILTVNVRYICVAITWVALVGRHGAVDREAISKTLFLASL